MKIIRAGKKSSWNENKININLGLTYKCNFSCSYCINRQTRERIGTDEMFNKTMLKTFLKDLFTLNREHYAFEIAGGEPLIYPNLLDFYSILQEKSEFTKIIVGLSTNGSMLHKLIPCIESCPDIEKAFMISIHEEQYSLEKYFKILKNFKYAPLFQVKYLLHPQKFENFNLVKEFCKDNGYIFTPFALETDGKIMQGYSEDEISLLKEYEYETRQDFFIDHIEDETVKTINFSRTDYIQNLDLINYVGLYCTAGYSRVNITPKGKVYRCYADKTKVDFSLKEHSFLEYPNLHNIQPCFANKCGCPPCTGLPKWRKGVEAPQYIIDENITLA